MGFILYHEHYGQILPVFQQQLNMDRMSTKYKSTIQLEVITFV